ncbi:transglutaminase TgpA family protein [Dictyobacter arantiisoli]|uniref:Transglutaminase-like domain-containing protein n=1 Tax=Dictyobacter arantiisoli TaxID=2014874 RepID=A0A5A5TJR7_9CHLR|nr:transglutaminase domain-containing protein [Dictyobacter arantiisoli]GCF11134.1 hypothetical protein KDI_46980 [Dictyobacter arantiisoli]
MRSSLIESQRRVDESERDLHDQTGPSSVPDMLASDFRASRVDTPVSAPSSSRLPFPQEGWLAFLLLAIALYSVVVVIVNANWVHQSFGLYIYPIVGLLIGFGIAKLPFLPQALLHLLACVIGYFLALWGTAYTFHISWPEVVTGLRFAVMGQIAQQSSLAGESVFFFYLAFLCFFLGYFGSWLVYRVRLPWLVALVYSSIMLVNLNYVKNDFNLLILVMLGALLLLIARVHLATMLLQWNHEGLYTDKVWLKKLTGRCMQAACLVMAIVVALSWFFPVLAQPESGKSLWSGIDTVWNSALNGDLSWNTVNSFISSASGATNYFGNQLTISNSVHLPTGNVLSYVSSDHQSHYLEGVAFDHFSGNSWTNNNNSLLAANYAANASMLIENTHETRRITTSVAVSQTINGSKDYVFAPAQPISFSEPTQVLLVGDSNVGTTMTGWMQTQPLIAGSRYQVTSALSSAAGLENIPLPDVAPDVWLRTAWLRALYLQTPTDLSPDVAKTMHAWTKNDTNAYAALKSIESHLSDPNTFTYSLDNSAIPPNKDVVDWLLQTRTGYCTYYASTMAIMGRLLHIPTRLVTGFSSGKYDSRYKVWTVTGDDAHSWVQAYFPETGWIDFDPTPGYSTQSQSAPSTTPSPVATKPAVKATAQPTVQVPNNASSHPTPTEQQSSDPSTSGSQLVMVWIALGFLLLAFLFLVFAIYRRRTHQEDVRHSKIAGLYWRACRVAGWAGLGPSAWQTPYEYTNVLIRHLPTYQGTLWRMTELFVRERWGAQQHIPLEDEQTMLEHSWPALRAKLLRLFFAKKKL